MNNDVIVVLLSGLFAAVMAGLLVYIQGRRLDAAISEALDKLLENSDWLDEIEIVFDDAVDLSVQEVLFSLLNLAERLAAGTSTEADDKLVELLKEIVGSDAANE